ncbi:MAG TPA: undecaprenyl-diphosphate phosphatase [Planctomycetes bacterium]|nr:undecaprenyl-diphosphate phosphatase [Planctomycetota bacterium]
MTLVQAALLGLVQGLTEFLPVSSSGHLVLAKSWLGVRDTGSVAFEVVVHLGTLFAVLVGLRGPVLELMAATGKILQPGRWRQAYGEDPGFRRLVLLVPATLPAVVVGLGFADTLEGLFGAPRWAAAMLIATAVILLAPLPFGERRGPLGWRSALFMGIAQAVAIIPGISRSGSTISAGCVAGVTREEAGIFSFLMAIPAILGAVVLKADEVLVAADAGVGPLAVGFALSFLAGWFSLIALLGLVRTGRLWVFSPYLILVGSLSLIFG